MARPIIIVTGANGGVGFGICQRLLFQLSHAAPSDALPQSFAVDVAGDASSKIEVPEPYDGLTLIMACRSVKRAEAARTRLLGLLDSYIAWLEKRPGYDGHAHAFRENLVVDIVPIDLAVLSTVTKFAEAVTTRYPYISHLILNAGIASFRSIDWLGALRQILTDPVGGVTAPKYYHQHAGELSADALGWVWQSNLFGHYVLYRSIRPLLLAAPPPLGPARVVWSSSIEASPAFFDLRDWQNRENEHSYESTKYQIEIVATGLDERARLERRGAVVRHFVTHPGVCSTNVADALIGPVLNLCKLLVFYLVRLLGSPNHTISPYKAAIAAVHVCLAPLALVTLFHGAADDGTPRPRPAKFGAETDRWGRERVGVVDVKRWDEYRAEGEVLLERMEGLYEEVVSGEERRGGEGERAS